tara:strand:+ start:933 stop:1211 length:279 start_codon:yes stop_codon:yes gene_type:complete
MTQEELQLSMGGQYYVSAAKTFTAADKIAYLVINADAKFSALTDTDDNNVLTDSNLTSSVQIKSGMLLGVKSGAYFKQVTPTEGDCFGIKNK